MVTDQTQQRQLPLLLLCSGAPCSTSTQFLPQMSMVPDQRLIISPRPQVIGACYVARRGTPARRPSAELLGDDSTPTVAMSFSPPRVVTCQQCGPEGTCTHTKRPLCSSCISRLRPLWSRRHDPQMSGRHLGIKNPRLQVSTLREAREGIKGAWDRYQLRLL